MTKLSFFGGIGTIGGNCCILENNGSQIMLDNGMCFSKERNFYKDFLSARMGNGVRDFLNLGLIPKIGGIYGKEKLIDTCVNSVDSRAHYMLTTDLESYEAFTKRNGHPYIDAIILSHLHLDHTRNLIFMAPEIPVICSQITYDFLTIISDMTNYDFLNYDYRIRSELGKTSYFPSAVKKSKLAKKRSFIISKPKEVIEISNFKIIGYPVDHSVPGAMAFRINTSDKKNIVYTGDIRFHGHDFEKESSENFVKEISSIPIDILITEGTRINEEVGLSEGGVFDEILKVLKSDIALNEKMIFASFPWKSISRFLTVFKIAKELGRILVVHPKLAYVLHHFRNDDTLGIKNILHDSNIRIYQPRKSSMLYSKGDYVNAKECISFETNWKNNENIKSLLYPSEYGENIFVTAYDIHEKPQKYILQLEFYSLSELIDIRPPEHSYYFNLKTEPFNEEGMIEQKVLENWIKRYNLDFKTDIHASGHASGKEILDMINTIKPKKVFPIHTEHPELFNMRNSENRIITGKEYTI